MVNTLNRIKEETRNIPQRIQVDNGQEFVSKGWDIWAYENNVILDFSRPGRPTDNPFIESFNGSFREECLNTNWFLPLSDARAKIEPFRRDYNSYRPHSSLKGMTPEEAEIEYVKNPKFLLLNCPKSGSRSIKPKNLKESCTKTGISISHKILLFPAIQPLANGTSGFSKLKVL